MIDDFKTHNADLSECNDSKKMLNMNQKGNVSSKIAMVEI